MKKLTFTVLIVLLAIPIYCQNAESGDHVAILDTNNRIDIYGIKSIIADVNKKSIISEIAYYGIPILSLLIALATSFFSYKQNASRNRIDTITKSEIQWLNDLNNDISCYVKNIRKLSNIEEVINLTYRLKLKIGIGGEYCDIANLKIEFAEDIVRHISTSREYLNNLAMLLAMVNNNNNDKYRNIIAFKEAIKKDKQFDEIDIRVIKGVLSEIEKDDVLMHAATKEMLRKFTAMNNEIVEWEGKYLSQLDEMNKKIAKHTNQEYKYVTLEFGKKEQGNFSDYFIKSISPNIEKTLYEVSRLSWNEIKKSI